MKQITQFFLEGEILTSIEVDFTLFHKFWRQKSERQCFYEEKQAWLLIISSVKAFDSLLSTFFVIIMPEVLKSGKILLIISRVYLSMKSTVYPLLVKCKSNRCDICDTKEIIKLILNRCCNFLEPLSRSSLRPNAKFFSSYFRVL